MLRWFVWAMIVVTVAGFATAYIVYKRQQQFNSDYGRRFPFVAHENGQLLIEEDGRPVRFRTREDAHRYEQEYKYPLGTVEGGPP